MSLVPVTILTGFLGSGKTTLLNRILKESHGQRIAVIENEFGEAGIDNDILLQDTEEQIVEMNNGCICCTVRGDLVRILGELRSKRQAGQLHFDRVVIETTGLADPAPVAQTFFVEDDIVEYYLLDAVITLVDAKHAWQQLDEHHEAQEQVGFADRLLITKTDLIDPESLKKLQQRLRKINSRAPFQLVNFGKTELKEILDIRGFNLNAILEIEPDFLQDVSHEHDDDVSSFVYRQQKPFDAHKVEEFIGAIIQIYGQQLLRYKGVLYCADVKRRLVLQGVHMLFGTDVGAQWRAEEIPETRFVFIGKQLPEEMIRRGLDQCLARLDSPAI
ncbi:MAG: GTP-binding protein [Burkholderiales bacterium]|jgi:G3E family GTPase|nr:GTP-binding protein [Burkholderiales bacterium]